MTVAEWARETGIKQTTIYGRPSEEDARHAATTANVSGQDAADQSVGARDGDLWPRTSPNSCAVRLTSARLLEQPSEV